jgi:transposase
MKYVGIDIHKEFCQVIEVNHNGTCCGDYRVDLCDNGIEKLKSRMDKDTRIILEAGGNSFSIASSLEPYVHDVTVVHPAKTRSIAASKIKTDKYSAETLARLLASGYVTPVWVPDIEVQNERALISYRAGLIKARTAYKNRVHAILYRRSVLYSKSELFKTSGRLFLAQSFPHLEEVEKAQVISLFKLIDTVNDEIELIDGHLAYLARDREDARLLMTIPGVSVLIAMALLAEIGDIHRFPSPDHLSSYAGLVPRIHQTGKSVRRGGITHTGRNNLRSYLFIAILLLTRRPGKMRDFYLRLLPKGKKVALVACARKLLVIIWKMLMHKKPFRDNDPDLTRRKSMMIDRAARPYPLEHSPHLRAQVTTRT